MIDTRFDAVNSEVARSQESRFTCIAMLRIRATAAVILMVFVMCFAAQTFAAQVNPGDIWQGTIGTLPIVVKLDSSSAEISGTYFYRKRRLEIELSGQRTNDGSLQLKESVMGSTIDDKSAIWHLNPPENIAVGNASKDAGKEVMKGKWSGADGKMLPIVLQRVVLSALPAAGDDPGLIALRKDDPFTFLRLNGTPLKRGKLETVGSYRLQWWNEPGTGVALFRVLSGYPAPQLAVVNRVLSKRHWEEINSALGCLSAQNADYDTSTTLRYIGRDALSVSLFTSYYCGGAHPDFGDSPLNLDPRSGRELVLEDVLWLGKGKPPQHDGPEQEAWFDYRGNIFAPWVASTMKRLYPTEFKGETADDCSYDEADVWDFPTWYITDKGVYVGAIFARAARVCDNPDWSVLPWKEVRKHPGAVKISP